MLELLELWLPILLSAVGVFIVSSIIHMATPMHKGDYGKMAGEDAVMETMRAHGVNPGHYMFPGCDSMKAMGTPEMIERYKRGPVGTMVVIPTGVPTIGKSLIQWFVFSVIVSIFTAYVCTFALKDGAQYMDVFRLSGTVAFMGYGLATICDSIWKGVSWLITLKFQIDSLLYALMTAGVFAWLVV
ncbi:MAG: hypothetical protein O2894_07460 [Planctomycetota bacterium]|nr:hypothetical protein [Planctomycetota bacterium]